MFQKKVKLTMALFAVLLGFFSCNLNKNEVQSGVLVIDINTDIETRSLIQPDLEMVISEYLITLTGPGTDVSVTLGSGVTNNVFTNLAPGTWNIKAEAKNSAGVIIASGSDTAVVAVAKTTAASITVVPLSGNGTLELAITWPEGLVSNPNITSTLIKGEEAPQNLNFTLSPEVSATSGAYSGFWAAGYYSLTLQLKDGDLVLWQRILNVRMIEGQVTKATYALTEDDLSNTANPETVGAVELNIGAELYNPFDMTLAGTQKTLHRDESMVLTVTDSSAAATKTIRWFINGQEQTGENGSSLTITGQESAETGIKLPHGRYWLDVLVAAGSVLNSKTAFFDIPEYKAGDQGPAGGIVFYDKGKVTDGWRFMEAWHTNEPATLKWAASTSMTPSGTGKEIGAGYNNTYNILSGGDFPAAMAAINATYGGRGDWFLPSNDELSALYKQRSNAALNLSDSSYWSSSFSSSGKAWFVNSSYPNGYSTTSTASLTVRVVRRF